MRIKHEYVYEADRGLVVYATSNQSIVIKRDRRGATKALRRKAQGRVCQRHKA